MNYQNEVAMMPTDISGEMIHRDLAAEIAARADAEIAALRADAERWRFFMTDPDGFEVNVRETDDDGFETWYSCYPMDEFQQKIDAAREGGGNG